MNIIEVLKKSVLPFAMVVYLGQLMILDITKSETLCRIFEVLHEMMKGWDIE